MLEARRLRCAKKWLATVRQTRSKVDQTFNWEKGLEAILRSSSLSFVGLVVQRQLNQKQGVANELR